MKACEAFEYTLIVEQILFFAHPRRDLGAMTGSERQATPLLRGGRLTCRSLRSETRRAPLVLLWSLPGIELSLGNSDSLSSEQTRIHGPCAGANHCEGSAQCRQHEVHRTVAGGEQEKRQF